MKQTLYKIILSLLALGSPLFASAAIEVNFESSPLFGAENFLPGDTISKTVEVTNTYDDAHNVYTELINVTDNDGLGDVIDVEIENGGTIYSQTFAQFEADNSVFLSNLGAGDTVTYTFHMTFRPEAGNEYQNAELGFDLCIGLDGGNFACDDGEEEGPGDGDGGGDGGGGGGGGGGTKKTPNDPDEPDNFGEGGGFPLFGGETPFGEVASAQDNTLPEEPEGEIAGAKDNNLPNSLAAVGAAAEIFSVDCECVLPILLTILGVFYAWVLLSDGYRGPEDPRVRKFFRRNTVFVIAAVILILILHYLDLLCPFWWLVLIGIILWFFFDFYRHKQDLEPWDPAKYHYWHVFWFSVIALLSFIFSLDCLLIPMIIATAFSLIWLILSKMVFTPKQEKLPW